eukprot:SAG31_NODE_14797_length_787_cov_0.892442_1_plen_134_part_00
MEANAAAEDDDEYEVDGVTSCKYTYGKYRYAVSFKGHDEQTKHLPRDDADLEKCQKLIDEFDAKHPHGSLPKDKPTNESSRLCLLCEILRDNTNQTAEDRRNAVVDRVTSWLRRKYIPKKAMQNTRERRTPSL